MSPVSRKYQPEYAFELFRIAQGDLESARGLFKVHTGRIENVVYLCQQSIEKSMKAVLCHLSMDVPMSHDLDLLVSVLPSDLKPPEFYRLGLLTQYATIRRYEEGYEVLDDQDLVATIDLGEKIELWAKTILAEKYPSKKGPQ